MCVAYPLSDVEIETQDEDEVGRATFFVQCRFLLEGCCLLILALSSMKRGPLLELLHLKFKVGVLRCWDRAKQSLRNQPGFLPRR
jgi:hypothetical protein